MAEQQLLQLILARLDRLERIETLLTAFTTQKPAQEWLTPEELGAAVGRAAYTCREWARRRQIPAKKNASGRGWIISRDVVDRIQAGELPIPEHELIHQTNGHADDDSKGTGKGRKHT